MSKKKGELARLKKKWQANLDNRKSKIIISKKKEMINEVTDFEDIGPGYGIGSLGLTRHYGKCTNKC